MFYGDQRVLNAMLVRAPPNTKKIYYAHELGPARTTGGSITLGGGGTITFDQTDFPRVTDVYTVENGSINVLGPISDAAEALMQSGDIQGVFNAQNVATLA